MISICIPSTLVRSVRSRRISVPIVDLRDSPGTTSNGLVATLALPDSDRLPLDGVLAAEGADVAGVLGDFHLLHLLTQGGTISVVKPMCQQSIQNYLIVENIVVDLKMKCSQWRVRGAYLVPYLPVTPTSVESN